MTSRRAEGLGDRDGDGGIKRRLDVAQKGFICTPVPNFCFGVYRVPKKHWVTWITYNNMRLSFWSSSTVKVRLGAAWPSKVLSFETFYWNNDTLKLCARHFPSNASWLRTHNTALDDD